MIWKIDASCAKIVSKAMYQRTETSNIANEFAPLDLGGDGRPGGEVQVLATQV